MKIEINEAERVHCADCVFYASRDDKCEASDMARSIGAAPEHFCALERKPTGEIDKFAGAIEHIRKVWSEHCLNLRKPGH